MKFCPACVMVRIEAVIAACPEANASPPMPPSSAASRFSSTSLVGFMIASRCCRTRATEKIRRVSASLEKRLAGCRVDRDRRAVVVGSGSWPGMQSKRAESAFPLCVCHDLVFSGVAV